MRRLPQRLSSLRDESGNITAIVTAMILLLTTTLLPLVWNVGAAYAARRQSQNGSDAAALAAAEEVARSLNAASTDWWGCIPPQTNQLIVQSYVGLVVVPIGGAGGGSGAAAQYAANNRSTLTQYSQGVAWVAPDNVHARLVDGVTVPPIRISVGTRSEVRGSLMDAIYRTNQASLRARARSEVYLDKVHKWQTPCPAAPTKAIAQHYRFEWKIRLIATD
jgi:hypothetical protein